MLSKPSPHSTYAVTYAFGMRSCSQTRYVVLLILPWQLYICIYVYTYIYIYIYTHSCHCKSPQYLLAMSHRKTTTTTVSANLYKMFHTQMLRQIFQNAKAAQKHVKLMARVIP